MKHFIVYNKESGKIISNGTCPDGDVKLQIIGKPDASVMEGIANNKTQKIVDGEVVDKTPQEITEDTYTPPVVTHEKQPALITNEQWQDVLSRLEILEAEA